MSTAATGRSPAPRLITLVLAVLLSALAVSGCGRAHRQGAVPDPTEGVSIEAGSSVHSLATGSCDRSYRLYRPATLAEPAALVVMLHGGFGSASQAEQSYGWDAAADAHGFLMAYPDGLNHAWNVGGGCCGKSGAGNVDDVGFIAAMVGQLTGSIALSSNRIYATGISNGGMMAYRLACDTALFAAIGPDSATMLGPCAPGHPLSVIHLHGTADHNIPYDGGTGSGVAKIDGPAVPALNARWRAFEQCAPPVTSTTGALTTSVASCPAGRAVKLITIAGAGHQWPGAEAKPVAEKLLGLDPPSTSLDATATIWQFFAEHSG
ncbi:MAG: PHB depolymerase family esterase [Jatrophihabitantaceae bacterium]